MIYAGLLILLFGIFIFLFILNSQRKVRNKFLHLDEELKQLLNQENFITQESGNYKLKDLNSIKLTIQSIKINQSEWNSLFNQKYVNNSSRYSDTTPRDSRERHLDYLLQDIESLVKKLSINGEEKEYIKIFSRMFNNEGVFMPVEVRDFTKIETPIKTNEILELDKRLIDLSKKSVYLKNVDGINSVTDLTVYLDNKEEILKNINDWVQITSNLRTVNDSQNTRDYLINRKLFSEDLLRELEKIVRKESNPDESLDQIYLKSFINRLSTEGFNSERLQAILNKCREYY